MRRFVTVNFCMMLCFVIGCGPSNKIAKDFDYGKIEGHVYKNDFFKFEITAPEGWHVIEPEKISEIQNEGIDTFENKDAMENLRKRARVTSANLWMCSKYDFDDIPDGEYNPHIVISAEKLPTNAKGLTVEKYFEVMKKQIQKIAPAARFKPMTKETISGKEFGVQKITMPLPGAPDFEIQQESRICFINNHALLVAMNYFDDGERPDLQSILETIKFN